MLYAQCPILSLVSTSKEMSRMKCDAVATYVSPPLLNWGGVNASTPIGQVWQQPQGVCCPARAFTVLIT